MAYKGVLPLLTKMGVQVFLTLFLLLPLVFSTPKFSKKRNFLTYFCENAFSVSEKDGNLQFTEDQLRHLKQFDGEFEKYVELCTDGRYHQLPLDFLFFCHRDHADYLALAIKARDSEAIAFSKKYVEIECPSVFLQSALLDMIIQEDTDIIEILGDVFPNIYTNIFIFREPLAHLSGTSLIRIAVDQNRNKAAVAMFKSVPVSLIGDYWHTIDFMRKFLVSAMKDRQIRLKPKENEQPISFRILVDMFFNCVLEKNLEALDYLHESTGIPLDTLFTNENGLSFSAMFIAAHAGYNDIVSYLGRKCPKLFHLRSGNGMLPIHTAAANGHLDVVKSLSVARDTMTDSVSISGTSLTPFGLAIRNKKIRVAFVILSLIEKDSEVPKEIQELVHWAILDDNVQLLEIYFEYNSFPALGCINESYNLLEMALTGSNDPKTFQNKRSSIKCLQKLIDIWKEKELPFHVSNETLRGSILALVPLNDLDAFQALIKQARVDPNGKIFEITPNPEGGGVRVKETNFLNRIIAKGATEMVPFAIKHGADPRIIDDDGLDAYETAIKYKNQFVIDLFDSIYDP